MQDNIKSESEQFDAKFDALQTVARMAYEYINNLQPGDIFSGPQAEAAKHFEVGSEGYGIFIGCALNQLRRVVMDLDAERRIVSIVKVKVRRASHTQEDLVSALQEAIKVIQKIKPTENGNGTVVRGLDAIAKAGVKP